MGKVITVWGSPGSGKSMFSCILAKALTRDKRKAIIINAEISVPMLPVWLPEQIIQTNASVGQVLSSVEIDTSLVAGHVTVLKSYPFIGVMGYAAGENPLSYPEVKYAMVLQLVNAAARLVDFVILDCSSNMTNVFTPAAIESGDLVIRILTPDLKGVNYLKAHQPLLGDGRFHYDQHMTFAGMARPFHALDEMGHIIGGWDGLLPYRRIDNLDIAGIVLPVLQEMEGMHFESCQLTDSRMYIKVVNTRLEAEVVPGDIVQSGIIISNSEVGLGSVSIQPLVYRLVCSNGMVVNDAQTRRNHVGRVNEASENYQLYSEKTLEADDKAFAMKIQDTVRAVVDEVRFTRVVNMMREAKDAPMNTAAVPDIVKLVSKDFHITDDESSGVLQRLIEGNDLTLYGLSNAVTRHSQDVKDYDRATALEGIGYNILSMPARQWSRINQMAA